MTVLPARIRFITGTYSYSRKKEHHSLCFLFAWQILIARMETALHYLCIAGVEALSQTPGQEQDRLAPWYTDWDERYLGRYVCLLISRQMCVCGEWQHAFQQQLKAKAVVSVFRLDQKSFKWFCIEGSFILSRKFKQHYLLDELKKWHKIDGENAHAYMYGMFLSTGQVQFLILPD